MNPYDQTPTPAERLAADQREFEKLLDDYASAVRVRALMEQAGQNLAGIDSEVELMREYVTDWYSDLATKVLAGQSAKA